MKTTPTIARRTMQILRAVASGERPEADIATIPAEQVAPVAELHAMIVALLLRHPQAAHSLRADVMSVLDGGQPFDDDLDPGDLGDLGGADDGLDAAWAEAAREWSRATGPRRRA